MKFTFIYKQYFN